MSHAVIGSDLIARQVLFKMNRQNKVPFIPANRNPNLTKYVKDMEKPRTIVSTEDSSLYIQNMTTNLQKGDIFIDLSPEYYKNIRFKEDIFKQRKIKYISGAVSDAHAVFSGNRDVYNNELPFLSDAFHTCTYVGEKAETSQYIMMVQNALNDTMIQGLHDVFSYGSYETSKMIDFIQSCHGSDIDGRVLRTFKFTTQMIKDPRFREFSFESKIPCPVINSSNEFVDFTNYRKYISMQTSNNLHYNEQVARNALRFVFATVILEGISVLQSKPIQIKQAYNYLSTGSSIRCDMFRKNQLQLYDILSETEHDTRMFLMQCVSAGIPCPAIQAALNQHDSMKYYPVELI